MNLRENKNKMKNKIKGAAPCISDLILILNPILNLNPSRA